MGRKRILLLGDSIMYGVRRLHGYGYYLRQILQDRADVYLPTDNCQDVRYLYSCLTDLIPEADGAFDVIHWNSGLWDVLHFIGNPRPHTLIEDYEKTVALLYDKLAALYPRAEIYFATTTMVSEHLQRTSSYRRNAEVAAYNAAACRALEGKVKAIDDLYTFSLSLGDEARSEDGLHYSEETAAILADEVYRFLLSQNSI